jgi:hypothetical protein
MIATSYLDWDIELTSMMISKAFNGLLKEFVSEEEK